MCVVNKVKIPDLCRNGVAFLIAVGASTGWVTFVIHKSRIKRFLYGITYRFYAIVSL